MTEMTQRQRELFDQALARSTAQEKRREEVPTQRVRTAAQGATFGFADEIEARARSLATGRPYEDVLGELRGQIKAYKEARPLESMAYEMGGAFAPALLPGGQSSLVRAAGRAAAEGAAYAFGTGEGGFAERAARVPGGAVAGGALGGAAYAGTRAIGGAAKTLLDAARRRIGGRGAAIVEQEIQRLVEQTGRTVDEIAQDVIDGRLLAENATIRQAVRGLFTKGGPAQVVLKEGLEQRPAQTAGAAMEEMKGSIGAADVGSEAAARRASDDATKAAERAAYGAFADDPAPQEAVDALAEALRRVPTAAREIGLASTARGVGPLFSVAEDGAVVFNRRPTVREAESVRRAINNRASSLYRSESMGMAGEAVSEVEGELRSILDFSIPDLRNARAQAAAVRADRDAYIEGVRSLSGDVNEKLADFAALAQKPDPEAAIAAFRAGLMQALEARAATGSRASMIRNLTDDTKKEGMLLREVFPQDDIPDVLRTLETAREAQATASRVLGGSDTASSTQEAKRFGNQVSMGEVAGMLSGDPQAIAGMAQRMVNSIAKGRELSDAERARIARILVSENADLVRRAMQDTSGFAALTEKAGKLIDRAVATSRAAGAQQGGGIGGDVSGDAIRGLLVPPNYEGQRQ